MRGFSSNWAEEMEEANTEGASSSGLPCPLLAMGSVSVTRVTPEEKKRLLGPPSPCYCQSLVAASFLKWWSDVSEEQEPPY